MKYLLIALLFVSCADRFDDKKYREDTANLAKSLDSQKKAVERANHDADQQLLLDIEKIKRKYHTK